MKIHPTICLYLAYFLTVLSTYSLRATYKKIHQMGEWKPRISIWLVSCRTPGFVVNLIMITSAVSQCGMGPTHVASLGPGGLSPLKAAKPPLKFRGVVADCVVQLTFSLLEALASGGCAPRPPLNTLINCMFVTKLHQLLPLLDLEHQVKSYWGILPKCIMNFVSKFIDQGLNSGLTCLVSGGCAPDPCPLHRHLVWYLRSV